MDKWGGVVYVGEAQGGREVDAPRGVEGLGSTNPAIRVRPRGTMVPILNLQFSIGVFLGDWNWWRCLRPWRATCNLQRTEAKDCWKNFAASQRVAWIEFIGLVCGGVWDSVGGSVGPGPAIGPEGPWAMENRKDKGPGIHGSEEWAWGCVGPVGEWARGCLENRGNGPDQENCGTRGGNRVLCVPMGWGEVVWAIPNPRQ